MELKRFTLIVGLGLLAVRGYADPVAICVSSTNDAGTGSLREAIEQANAAGGGAITFCFPVGTTNTITLLTALPSLAANISITGPGTNQLIVSGGNQCAVFSMNSGTTNTLSGLTVANGTAKGYYLGDGIHSPQTILTNASGIANSGSLRLLNCVVRNCTNFLNYGHGIYNSGVMEMDGSLVADCYNDRNYGNNGAGDNQTQGGGIYNQGALRMTNCRISRCEAAWNGTSGGGILNVSNLTMTTSVIESCLARSGNGDGGGIFNSGTATAVLNDCTVSNCSGGLWGGGIISYGTLAITNSSIVGNRASQGGGIFLSGTNLLVNCTIALNRASDGGGIYNYGGELRMFGCTVSGNTNLVGGIINGKYYSAVDTNATIYVDSCTIVSNTTTSSEDPVGVQNRGTFYVRNTIIAGNGTNNFAGELISQGFNLIQPGGRMVSMVNSGGGWVFQPGSITGDVTGNRLGVDPLVGPLQDNGGPTWTHALLPGSPAIDHGNSAGVLTDQRGVARLFDDAAISNEAGDGSDIGAYESGSLPTAAMLPIAAAPGGLAIRFSGINGYTYSVQRAVAVGGPWETISPASVGPNGVGSFVDPNPPTSGAFYRTAFP